MLGSVSHRAVAGGKATVTYRTCFALQPHTHTVTGHHTVVCAARKLQAPVSVHCSSMRVAVRVKSRRCGTCSTCSTAGGPGMMAFSFWIGRYEEVAVLYWSPPGSRGRCGSGVCRHSDWRWAGCRAPSATLPRQYTRGACNARCTGAPPAARRCNTWAPYPPSPR